MPPSGSEKMDQKSVAQALLHTLQSPHALDLNGEAANVVDGLFALAHTMEVGLKWLGTGDAATPMGALEALGKAILDTGERIADSINNLAEAIRETRGD